MVELVPNIFCKDRGTDDQYPFITLLCRAFSASGYFVPFPRASPGFALGCLETQRRC